MSESGDPRPNEPEKAAGAVSGADLGAAAGADAGATAGADMGAAAGARAGVVAGAEAGAGAGADDGALAGADAGALAGAGAGGAAGAAAGAVVGSVAGKEAAIKAGQTIDLTSATTTSPTGAVQQSGQQMSGLQSAGVDLAKWVLTIIVCALSVLTILVASSEIWPTSEVTEIHKLVLDIHSKSSALAANDEKLLQVRKDLLDLSRQIVDAKQAQRSFWIQFSQMILLNLLLPVLTAILGYVFGANSSKN